MNFLKTMLSDSGEVSFGRCAAGAWAVFLMVQQAWFWHRTGHLVDNGTAATHLGYIVTLYGLGKVPAKLNIGN